MLLEKERPYRVCTVEFEVVISCDFCSFGRELLLNYLAKFKYNDCILKF